ncbi:MAG: hypothetical protein R3A46_06125 [Thermomicrobiales bacterium]
MEKSVTDVINELIDGSPSIAVSQSFLQASALGINPMVLQPGEIETISDRIRAAVTGG